MASVTSLDQDMKRLRLGRYTPQAAAELRAWIEAALGESLPAGDLLDALKDGTVLCRLATKALPTPLRFKKSAMPFIQMENIAQFLRACELPPLAMPAHDRFLTVDLFEAKDPAQVLQCLAAFSRAAHHVRPDAFPAPMGPKRGGANTTPTPTPTSTTSFAASASAYTSTNTSTAKPSFSATFNPLKPPPAKPKPTPLSPARSGRSSPSRPSTATPTPVSPSAGVSSWSKKADQGVTSPAWNIHQYGYMGGASQGNQGIAFGARRQITSAGPTVPSIAEKERKRREKAEADERLRVAADEQEERQRAEEERLWEEEARKQREAKEQKLEDQRREWEEQERQWKKQEDAKKLERQREEREAKAAASNHDTHSNNNTTTTDNTNNTDRIADLERQLLEAKERERQYQQERETRKDRHRSKSRTRERSKSRARPQPPPRDPSPPESNVSWAQADDRAYLRDAWSANQLSSTSSTSSRPLPDPTAYKNSSQPATARATPHQSPTTTRTAPPQSPKHRATPSQTLLEREMERERERQKEWESAQRELLSAAKDPAAGTGQGQSWDVNQYGYMGGDSQNKGGISFGGRRQILGPRPFGQR